MLVMERTKRYAYAGLLLAVVVIAAVAVAMSQLQSFLADQALDNLKKVNHKVAFELHRQVDSISLDGKGILLDAKIRASIKRVFESPVASKVDLFELRKMLAGKLFARHYQGFYLIDDDERIIGSMKDKDIGVQVPTMPATMIDRLKHGEQAIISHPFKFNGNISMWLMLNIVGDEGKHVGYLALVLGNQHHFTQTTSTTGIASRSTETYLVNRQGFMLSEPRHTEDAMQAGLLNRGEKAVLTLKVVDPDINLLENHRKTAVSADLPLTLAVKRVLEEQRSGWSTECYRDYRGIQVMGAWHWDQNLDAAIITEVDVDEVMGSYNYVRNIIFILLFIMLVAGLVSAIAFGRLRARSERDVSRHRNLLLESTAESIYGLDMDGNCTFVNQSFLNLLGYEEAEVIGKNIHSLIHHSYADGSPYPIEACCVSKSYQEKTRMHRDDECYWHKDGRAISVEYWAYPMFEGDDVVGSVVTFLDISAQLKAEYERSQMEKQVQHSQRLESLGILAGGIAHDFNNLLSAILGNAFLAESNILKDPLKAKERVSRIVLSADKAAVLCKQMLAYSGKGQFILKPINISEAVEEMTHLMEVSIDKSVVINYHLAEGLPHVMVDEAQIQQVILNLITNANDAIAGKSGIISITTGMMHADRSYLNDCYGNNPAAGRFIYVEVSDSGCGMSKETIQKVFDPFFTTKVSGRGLGMSAVLGIVRGHQGALKVYSELGRGTTFKFLLPVGELEKIEDADSAEIRPVAKYLGGTVLVVDDEETVREMACMMLQAMGFETLAAANGKDGLAQYKKHQASIVLVLSDLTMPHMGGKELFRQLMVINPQCRVILSSGYNSEDAIQQFSGKGLAGFLQKPFSPTALSDAIREILGEEV